MEVDRVIGEISRIIWGWPLIAALSGIGVFLSFRLKFPQIFQLKTAIKYITSEKEDGNSIGDVSNFASFCTALSATIGTGNIVGVALAIAAGGPGALFWIWVSAFFGMAVKYAECVLAVRYRRIGSDGKIAGGPMYYIEEGLNSKFLAKIFAFAGIVVALTGIGTLTQSNSIAAATAESFGIPKIVTAILLGIIVAVVTLGGIHKISYISEKIMPLACLLYVCAAIVALVINIELLPHAIYMIFVGAFSPQSIFGGGVGITAMTAMQLGISRGIFSHESGLGSAAIAAAAAKTDSPVKQGLISMTGTFFSIIVCTMTGLVLIITSKETGVFTSECIIDGALLTSHAFEAGIGISGIGKHIVNFGILFFAFTTIIGWNYYGEKCVQYLWGIRVINPYRMLFLFFVVIGPFFKIDMIFVIADIVTGLMTIPNLIGLIALRKTI
ncbi:MAG: sodium:alanine symporter family protein [Holosporaceae bacterium]|jgi:AGCS family alanine or glycine:cation symporter|nr:sodium:alanine symporter family protein [Holosporaceae bacterium]